MVARLYQYKIPLDTPRWPFREGLILQWNDGWGEIAPLPGFSSETLAEALEETLGLLPNLCFANPTLPSVRFGLSCAALPFSQKPVNLSICALDPPLNCPLIPVVKLKLGHLSVPDAIGLVKRHYKKSRLRLDCNRAWTLDQALSFASHFEKTDFDYLEEPVQNFQDLYKFSQITQFPIGVQESLLDSPWQEIPTLKAVIVKPMILGTIPEVPKGVQLIFSSSYETGLGLLHLARLSAHSPFPPGIDTYRALKGDILSSPIVCSGGIFSWTPQSLTPPINVLKLCLIASVP
ncbi:MAG: enolase C-terminal domain-like protein [Chlamydiota bacterium]